MNVAEFKPCPYCGTGVGDPDKPASEIQGGGYTLECGDCGARWPLLTREKLDTMSSDTEVIAFFNQRKDAS